MRPIVSSPDGVHDKADALLSELSRLQSEVREAGQQLDRIEAAMRHALSGLAHDRFEEYR